MRGWEAARLTVPLTALIVSAAAVSLIEGAPVRLPGVTLGSDVLLHPERAAATFAIVAAVVSVLREAARGRLPTQLTTAGLAYEEAHVHAAAELQLQLDALRGQVQDLAETVGVRGLRG